MSAKLRRLSIGGQLLDALVFADAELELPQCFDKGHRLDVSGWAQQILEPGHTSLTSKDKKPVH